MLRPSLRWPVDQPGQARTSARALPSTPPRCRGHDRPPSNGRSSELHRPARSVGRRTSCSTRSARRPFQSLEILSPRYCRRIRRRAGRIRPPPMRASRCGVARSGVPARTRLAWSTFPGPRLPCRTTTCGSPRPPGAAARCAAPYRVVPRRAAVPITHAGYGTVFRVVFKSCGSDEVARCRCHGWSYGRPGIRPVVTCATKRLSARGFRITCRFASPASVVIAARRSGRLRRR